MEQGNGPHIPEGFSLEPDGRFRCNTCQIFCSSLAVAANHARGKRHLKAIGGVQWQNGVAVPNGVNWNGDEPILPVGCTQNPNGWFRCQVCNIVCSCQLHIIQHVLGRKHLGNLVQKNGSTTNCMVTMLDGSWLMCSVCQVVCNTQKTASEHVKGQKHLLQCRIKALKENRDKLVKSPRDIELSCPNITKHDVLDCEVSVQEETTLTVTVTNRSGGDLLNLRCNLLKGTKANVVVHKSQLQPGESGAVDINVQGHHLGVNTTALAFLFTWQSQPDQRLHVVRQLRVRCTDDIVKQLQPTTKYKRPRRRKFEPRAEIVDGFPLPKMSMGNLEKQIPLGQYPIPRGLGLLHGKGIEEWDGITPEQKKQLANVQELLERELSTTNHCERFSLLLHCEELQMHIDIRNYDMQGVTMRRCKENRRLLTLQVPGLAENRPSVLKGDCLYVRPLGTDGNVKGNKEFKGDVHNTCLNEVWLGFGESFMDNFLEKSRFNVRFSVNRYPARMHHRSVALEQNRMDNVLFPTIASAGTWGEMQQVNELTVTNAKQHFKDRRLLENAQQVAAVCNIVRGVSRPAPYLVFGPPGTGKTVTIVEAMKQVLRVLPSSHILACAPSNSAADLLAERLLLHVSTAQMFRLNAGSRSIATVPDSIKPCCNIDQSTRAMYYPSKKELMKYSVIITTTVTAGRLVSAKFPMGHFTHVFIDEAGHAVEPEALVAIAGIIDSDHGGQIVLAGDPKQLGPVIRSPVARSWGLEMSLIERYMETCDIYRRCDDVYDPRFVTKLVCNYRSHPAILKLPNECFYDDELKPCADKLLRESLCQWEGLPRKGFPLIFHGVVGTDMREESSPSFFNPTEVSIVMDYVEKLLATRKQKITETDIGIISPYRKQVQKLQKVLKNHRNVKIGSVEDFQGQERRVIIISTVRSNPDFLTLDTEYRIGFLDNPKRFNVAVTRAKALLIVVGNPTILSKDKYWDMLLQECCSHGAYTGCELVSDDTAAGDVLQRLADMKLDDIIDDKRDAGDHETEGDVSAVTRHEGPEWRHDI